MINPLTLEERARSIRLIEHDLVSSVIGLISSGIGNNEHDEIGRRAHLNLRHLERALLVLRNFGREDIIIRPLYAIDLYAIIHDVKNRIHLGPSQSFDCELHPYGGELPTNQSMIYAVLFNLAKNSKAFIHKDGGKITLSSSRFSGEMGNLAYTAEGAPLSGDFVRFSVNDNGTGFPQGRNSAEFLEFGASTSNTDNSGYGLYFAKLIAKVLRSHITIVSVPGDTRVSLYHPLNLR